MHTIHLRSLFLAIVVTHVVALPRQPGARLTSLDYRALSSDCIFAAFAVTHLPLLEALLKVAGSGVRGRCVCVGELLQADTSGLLHSHIHLQSVEVRVVAALPAILELLLFALLLPTEYWKERERERGKERKREGERGREERERVCV